MSFGTITRHGKARVTPRRLLAAALAALVLAVLAVTIYPRLIDHGAASGLIALDQVLGMAAAAVTLLFPVAAIILRLARQDEPPFR
jgi:hypothetical protein